MYDQNGKYIIKVGAPKGGRIHWFLHDLSNFVYSNYFIIYNEKFHNYYLLSRSGRTTDNFTIIRTSQRCLRVMYHNLDKLIFIYKTFPNTQQLADFVHETALKYHKIKLSPGDTRQGE